MRLHIGLEVIGFSACFDEVYLYRGHIRQLRAKTLDIDVFELVKNGEIVNLREKPLVKPGEPRHRWKVYSESVYKTLVEDVCQHQRLSHEAQGVLLRVLRHFRAEGQAAGE